MLVNHDMCELLQFVLGKTCNILCDFFCFLHTIPHYIRLTYYICHCQAPSATPMATAFQRTYTRNPRLGRLRTYHFLRAGGYPWGLFGFFMTPLPLLYVNSYYVFLINTAIIRKYGGYCQVFYENI